MPSKLDQLQQQFRQRIDQRKEENLSSIRTYNESQQRVLERVSKSQVPSTSEPAGGKPTLSRRNGSGVDRSRPLKPLASRPPLLASQSTESAMVVGGASGKGRPNTAGAGPPVPQTRLEVQKTGASNTRILSKSNYTAAKSALIADPKVVSVTTTTTTFRMEKKNGTVTNGSRSAPSALKSVTTTVKTTEKKLPVTSNSVVKSSIATTTATKTTGAVAKGSNVPTSRSLPVPPRSTSTTSTSRASHNGPKVSSGPVDPNLTICSICGRSFAKDRIDKHKIICEKTTNKKRKVFDASKVRVKGTEAEQFVKKGLRKEEPKSKKTNWRHQHDTFISTIRQAKAVQRHLEAGGKLSDLPPPTPSENPDYIPCPHCGRKFNPGVADRHIPKCKNILSNKKPVPKKK